MGVGGWEGSSLNCLVTGINGVPFVQMIHDDTHAIFQFER